MKFLQSGWKKHIQRISTASFPSNREEKSCRKPKGTNPVLFNIVIELFHFCCSDSVQRGFKQTRLLWSLVACVKCLLIKTAKEGELCPSLPASRARTAWDAAVPDRDNFGVNSAFQGHPSMEWLMENYVSLVSGRCATSTVAMCKRLHHGWHRSMPGS